MDLLGRIVIGIGALCFFLAAPFLMAETGKEPTSSCIRCHEEQAHLWEKSIHYEMGNSCEGCHGGDPSNMAYAMSPAKGFVGAPKPEAVASFCGKCHVGVKENFLKSPHHTQSATSKSPNCITCHNSHDVKQASFDLINEETCSECHSYENGQKIKKAFVFAEMEIEKRKKTLASLTKRGMPTKRLEEELFSLRNSLHQMTHTLNLEQINKKTGGVLKELKNSESKINAYKEKIHYRWKAGAGVALFLIVLIFFLIRLLKTYEDEE
jgi:hypothetical protein